MSTARFLRMPVARRSRPAPEEIPGAAAFLPVTHTLPVLRDAVRTCHGCTLYKHATQAVFGEGLASAHVMFVGEVPGDAEDRAGRPFVGPSGQLLDEALRLAGIPRDEVYVTNAVKHFKYTLRGKRRIHDKPTRYEIEACRPWLASEIEALAPEIVVLLGATAAQTLLGRDFRITRARGQVLTTDVARYTFATVHPAAVLRAPDEASRHQAKLAFFADIALVGDYFRRR